MNWTPDDDRAAVVLIIALIVGLLIVRACYPSSYDHRISPPQSFYTPGG